MTTIFSIVDNSAQLAQRDEPRQPAQDFAHELAKQEAQTKQPAQNHAKATAGDDFEKPQTFEPSQINMASAMDDTLPKARMEAAMLQQGHAAGRMAVAPVGVTETLLDARVFGWHAMAQAYLSELTAADGSAKPLVTKPPGQASVMAAAEFASPAPAIAMHPAAPEAVSKVQPVETLAMQPAPATDDAVTASTVASTVIGGGAQALWPERSLRFTLRPDGSCVAWIRDFRLSGAEASHLVGWVLSDAKQKGLALGRIILNGREVWASPNLDVRSTP